METNNDKTNIKKGPNFSPRNMPAARRNIVILAAVFLVLLAGIWIWKIIQINNLEKQINNLEKQVNNLQKQAAAEKQMLRDQASQQLVGIHQQHLKLLAKPFVWAVRTEMLNNNISQVNLYANDLVKEQNFQSIVITNEKGIIISATDKKMEGKSYTTVGNKNYLAGNAAQVHRLNNELFMSSPIMGFNSRLGTLIITYHLQQPIFAPSDQ